MAARALASSLLSDLRFAARQMRLTPGFTAVATLTLAVGIGANTAVFSAAHALLVRALPFGESDRLAIVWEHAPNVGFPRNTPAPANFFDWKAENTVFTDMAATRSRSANLTGEGEPEQLMGRAVTANFFDVLGVRPLIGRTFRADEDIPESRVVLLSYGLWQRRYGGDTRLVGSTIEMDGAATHVAGVMPPGFFFPARDVDFWVPIGFSSEDRARRSSHFLTVVARLRPGVDHDDAQAVMSAIARRLEQRYPDTNEGVGAVVVPLRDDLLGSTRTGVLVLLAAAACVLLIACANLANLLLARGTARQREIGVRLALGAAPVRIVRQVITESLLLAAVGGALGILLARIAVLGLSKLVPPALDGMRFELDVPVLAFATGLTLLTALLFGAAPAAGMVRNSIEEGLRRGTPSGMHRSRGVRALVVAQVALAVVLLAGAGLMIRTLAALSGADPGFRTDRLLTMRTVLPQPRYKDDAKRAAFHQAVLERVRELPGVVDAAYASNLPFTSRGNTNGFVIAGRPAARALNQDAVFRVATSSYLQMMGVRLLAGRIFGPSDGPSAPNVLVINDTFARTWFPNENPVGHTVHFGRTPADSPGFRIVGVIADVRERGIDAERKAAVYLPAPQAAPAVLSWLAVRTAGDPKSVAAAVAAAVRSVDPQQPVALVRTMDELVALEVRSRREQSILFGIFAAVALLLAALGIYGVLAFAVSRRTREIGVRVALGAQPRQVMGMVVRSGVGMILLGLCVGLAGALALGRAMRSLLYETSAADPLTYVAGCAVLALAGTIACWVPAARAVRVDPMTALRED